MGYFDIAQSSVRQKAKPHRVQKKLWNLQKLCTIRGIKLNLSTNFLEAVFCFVSNDFKKFHNTFEQLQRVSWNLDLQFK